MNRPLKFDRNQALEKAMNHLWLHGIDASTVKRLSEELSITRSSFYNTFGSMEMLIKEVLALYGSSTPGAAFFAMSPDQPLKTELTRMLRALCHTRSDDPEHRGCLATNCAMQKVATGDDTGQLMRQKFAFMAATIEEKIQWAVNNEELPANTNPRTTAVAIQNLMFGINVQSMMLHDREELWKSCELALRGMDLLDETVYR